jgi:hypothetical protein
LGIFILLADQLAKLQWGESASGKDWTGSNPGPATHEKGVLAAPFVFFAFKNPQALTMRQFIRLDSDKSRQFSLSPDEAGFISATFDS